MKSPSHPSAKRHAALEWRDDTWATGRDGREYMIQSEQLDGAHGGRRTYAMWRHPKSSTLEAPGGWRIVPDGDYRRMRKSAKADAQRHEDSFQ